MPPPLYIFEDSQTDRLFPLTYSRAACELRAGALTLRERLALNFRRPLDGLFVRPGLAALAARASSSPVNPTLSAAQGLLLVNARWLLFASQGHFETPPPDTAGLAQSTIVWIHLSPALAAKLDPARLHEARTLEALLPHVRRIASAATLIDHPWQLLDHQHAAIIEDFARLGPANHAFLYPGVHLLAPENIHLAADVKIWPGAVLDAQGGPIIVDAGATLRANSVITGPCYIGPNALVRTGADIREDCSFGPGSRVGGELSNCLFLGNANKQHHGFLGNSIVGEWANLGAGTTTSNLKNTYGEIRMPINGVDQATGRRFLGSLIADHVKIGIGAYLSTGSVIGFASHIITPRPPRFVPSFAWVGDDGVKRANFEKLEQIAATVMQRRGAAFSDADHDLWVRIASEFSQSEHYPWPAE